MSHVFDQVAHDLLDSSSLTISQLQDILGRINGPKIDDADLYFQSAYSESFTLEDSIIKGGSFDIHRGVGLRVMSGEKTGFAYADDLTLDALNQAAKAAESIVAHGKSGSISAWHKKTNQNLYQPQNPLTSLLDEDKVNLLQRIDTYVREQDQRVTQVSIVLAGEYEHVLILRNDGTIAADIRPLVRLNVNLVVEDKGRSESGHAGGGARLDYQYFLNEDLAFHYAREALRQALLNLEAIDAPAGPMPVVLGSGWPGVLLHEAVGHGLEGDFNYKGISVYSGRMGQKVASELCTVVDNGAVKERRGSLNIDDEGTSTQCTVLIENGVLVNYMLDRRTARLMGMQSTGNGRRESYSHLPIPRMTNTYMLSGKSSPHEIIAEVKKGLYAVNFGGGQVDITSGKFVFSASEAYLIENGKISAPVKGATLIGNGPEILSKIALVGNDLELDAGVGVCGKDGQNVPVGVGQPTVLISEMTVGGTQSENKS